jgi:hypothetical protein
MFQPDPVRLVPCLRLGRTDDDLGTRQDTQVVLGPAGDPQPTPDVIGEGQCVVEFVAVRGEDHVGVARGEVAALGRVPGLEDHRVTLRAARQRWQQVDVELGAALANPRNRAGTRPGPHLGRVRCGRVGPTVPGRAGDGEELLGTPVPVRVVEVAAAPEVRAGPGIVGGHDVPPGSPAGEQVEAGEPAGEVDRLVEGRVRGADQADPVGDGGQRGELGDRVRPAGHVQVVNAPVHLAQAQAFAEEEGVEKTALRGLRDLPEGGRVDLRATGRVRPDRPVVDALEEHAEMQRRVRSGNIGGIGAGHWEFP